MIKDFQEYIKDGIVKRISPDRQRAQSLISDSERKMRVLNRQVEQLGVDDDLANEYILLCYDCLMLIVRAEMFSKGYNASGIGAHEAEISYMNLLGFSEKQIKFTDQMRYFRNGMLYYGTNIDKEYALKVIEFTKGLYSQMQQMLHKRV